VRRLLNLTFCDLIETKLVRLLKSFCLFLNMGEEFQKVEVFSDRGTVKGGVKTFFYLLFVLAIFYISTYLFSNRFDILMPSNLLAPIDLVNYPLVMVSYFLFIVGVIIYGTFFIHKNFLSSLVALAPFFVISLISFNLGVTREEFGYIIFAVPYFFVFMAFVSLACFLMRFYYKVNSSRSRVIILSAPFAIFVIFLLISSINMATLSVSDCDSTSESKEKCYSALAVKENDASVCENLGSYGYGCYSEVAYSSGDLSVCDEILLNKEVVGQFSHFNSSPLTDFDIISTCYRGVAVSKKDVSICDKIPSDIMAGFKVRGQPLSERDWCYDLVNDEVDY